MKSIKFQLTVLNFLQFAVWGSYLVSLGQFLGPSGLGDKIAWFYAMQGIVSIFMPALIGAIADKWIQGQKLLGICHFFAAVFMFAAWMYAQNHPTLEFAPFFTLYTLSVAFYMPTIALSNAVAFSVLKNNGLDTIKDFPPIRVLGTVGFIASMWFVNCFYFHEGAFGFTLSDSNPLASYRFQYTDGQLLMCALLGIILAVYSFTLPKVPCAGRDDTSKRSLADTLGLKAFNLFRNRNMAIFFIFAMLLGVALQITNGFATIFITSFKGEPEFANTFGANNATLLTSLSQISEALCILLIPFFLRRYGIKIVMLISILAWVFRFGCFGFGDPGNGLWLFIISMLVYGVAFDFFNVSGALFVEQETSKDIKASAQGLFMLMTNGIGASAGTLIAGVIVNSFVKWKAVGGDSYMIGDWRSPWLIFAGYALCVAILFAILFKYKHQRPEELAKKEVNSETLD